MPVIKYTSPDWEKNSKTTIMHRPQLYDAIEKHLHCQLIGIIADSGFGKTSLLQGYLSYYGRNTLWCALDDNEPVEDLLHEIFRTVADDPSLEAIVLDNCGILANEVTFSGAIPDLINLAPEATLFLLGTALPQLPFAVMRAKNQYYELTHDDLAFSRQETELYFNDYHALSLRPHEIDMIYDKTQGWVISLQLINAYLGKNHLQNLESLDLNFLSDITDINAYFSYNLFENQTLNMQQFLLETSPLTELETTVINEFLAIDHAETYLTELKGYHGFANMISGEKLTLHPLLRQFLYERYMRHESASCLAAHNRLILIYERKRNYILAFSHAVACNNYAAAIRLMTRISDRYNPIQLLNLIDGHLEEISPVLLFSNTSLFLQRCMPGKLIAEFVQPLTDALHHEYDSLRLANLQHRLGTIHYHLGNIQMAKDLLEKSLANSEMLHNTEVTAFNYQLLADCYLTMGDPTQALRCVRNALYLSEQNNITILQLHTLEVFSRIQLALGHTDQADEYISQALELAAPESYERFWLYAVQSAIDIRKEDALHAVSHAEAAAEIVRDTICEYDIAYTNLTLARALMYAGRPEEAAAHLELAREYSAYNGLMHIEILDSMLSLEQDENRKTMLKNERLAVIEQYHYENFLTLPGTDTAKPPASDPVPAAAPPIVIHTFDQFSILFQNRAISLKRSSSLRLLLLLIVNRGHFVSKDYIIETLFPDSSASTGMNNFNVSLSVLRKSLDSAAGVGTKKESCILRERSRYQLNTQLITIDAATFEERYRKLKQQESMDLNSWLELSALYSGTFLADYPYENFLSSERERLTAYQKEVSLTIARIYTQQGDFNKSLSYYNQVLELDAYDEDVYYEVIEMLLDRKSPVKAQAIAEKMKHHIQEELGISCQEQLDALFDYYQRLS